MAELMETTFAGTGSWLSSMKHPDRVHRGRWWIDQFTTSGRVTKGLHGTLSRCLRACKQLADFARYAYAHHALRTQAFARLYIRAFHFSYSQPQFQPSSFHILKTTMPSDGKDLSVVLEAQERRDLAPDVSSQVIKEMKNSLIFQNNWEDLLQSAPTSISCMGACFAASSSPKAVVKLTPPEKGWQYLR